MPKHKSFEISVKQEFYLFIISAFLSHVNISNGLEFFVRSVVCLFDKSICLIGVFRLRFLNKDGCACGADGIFFIYSLAGTSESYARSSLSFYSISMPTSLQRLSSSFKSRMGIGIESLSYCYDEDQWGFE